VTLLTPSRFQIDLTDVAPTLKHLVLRGDDCFFHVSHLAALTKLEVLDARRARFDLLHFYDLLEAIKSWPRFRELHLGRMLANDQAILHLGRVVSSWCRDLRALTLPLYLNHVQTATVISLVRECSRLEVLTCPGLSTHIHWVSVIEAIPFASLTHLSLRAVSFGLGEARAVATLSLRSLVIRGTHEAAEALVTHRPRGLVMLGIDGTWTCQNVANVVAALGLRSLMVDQLLMSPLTLSGSLPTLTTLRVETLAQHPCTRDETLLDLLRYTANLQTLAISRACLTFRTLVSIITGLPRLPLLTTLQLPRMMIGPPRLLTSVSEILDACPTLCVLTLGMRLEPRVLDTMRKRQIIVRF
jgi:hypothetical protein